MLFASGVLGLSAQPAASDVLTPIASGTKVVFTTTAAGVQLPVRWGLDTAWQSDENMRRGISYIGKENIGVVRVSFQPTEALVGDTALTLNQRKAVDNRIRLAKMAGTPELDINSDPADGKVDTWFTSSAGKADAAHWAKLIDVTLQRYRKAGLTVRTVAPFNEPDYGWGQGSIDDFREICRLLTTAYADDFADVRLSAGNTLNCDQASYWYNYMKPYVSEGCTHQLAGVFKNYASFFEEVRADGNHATADELHNVMEALVGVEYGMQTGIWWGFDGRARGEFCRASYGDRLAYAEDRAAWAAAAVYRNTLDNRIEAFVGTSERQAKPSSWHFACADRDVYFDGYGPTREFLVEMPGGNGYQNGQTNAERVVDISWGADVQPSPVDGTYIIVNRKSLKVLATEGGATTSGTRLVQAVYNKRSSQRWRVSPVTSTIGGDFSYHTLLNDANGYPADVWNWSLESGGEVRLYDGSLGTNEQWYLQYAGEGYYYIRSRYSNLCLEVAGGSMNAGVAVRQATFCGDSRQQWKIIAPTAACEAVPPPAPENVSAVPQSASVRLSWSPAQADDVAGYMVLRAPAATADGADPEWNTIARHVTDTSFVDNGCPAGEDVLYAVRAIDASDNLSPLSTSIRTAVSGEEGLTAHWEFDESLADGTPNRLDAASSVEAAYGTRDAYHVSGRASLKLDGNRFVQLPYGLVGTDDFTLSMWVFWYGSAAGAGQRLFEFASSADSYIALTPSAGSTMRLMFAHEGVEQWLDAPAKLPAVKWRHLAVSVSADSVALYMDGECIASTSAITLRSSDIRPVFNHIGRSAFNPSVPLLKAYIDDVRYYNRALDGNEISEIMTTTDIAEVSQESPVSVENALLYDITGRQIEYPLPGSIYIRNGRKWLAR